MLEKLKKINVKMVTQKPKAVLMITGIITLIAIVLASGLTLELNWVALAPKGNEAVQAYDEILQDFPTMTNIIVVVESDSPKSMQSAIKDLEKRLLELDDYVLSVTAGLDQDFILDYGLILSDEGRSYTYMLADPNLDSFMIISNEISKNLQVSPQSDYMLNSLEDIIGLAKDKNFEVDTLNASIKNFYSGNTLFTSEDGKMVMVTIQPTFDMMDIAMLEPGVNAIEEVVGQVSNSYSDVSLEATGMHVVARDETASIQSDSSLTTILAVLAIFALLYFAFRSFTAPLLAFVPLIIGIIWDVGFTKVVIGRLNMMTAFSAAMLVGLGIDYSIHLYSSYTERRSSGFDKISALSHALSITGPGIITGALTTAIAFIALNVSQLELLRELGTVMGIGIICTLISVFWVMPSLIILKREKETHIKKIKGTYPLIGSIAQWINGHKALVSILIILATVFMGYQSLSIEFDMNLMNLEPEGLKSIALMERLIDEYDMSSDSFSIAVDSLEQAYNYHQAFEAIDGVKEVVSIASFIPKEDVQNQRLEHLQNLEIQPYRDQQLITLETLKTVDRLKVNSMIQALEDPEHYKRFTQAFYNENYAISEQMLGVKILKANDLPASYKKQFLSSDGERYLITIYPDFNIWEELDSEKGEKFFKELRAVNHKITGTPVFMKVLYESVSDELLLIGAILLLVLMSILLLHFKSFNYSMKAIIPLLLTLVYMTGTMSLFNLKFNMLNFLSILLIIGIGIDYGVHILHHHKSGERKINYLFSNVGRAILLTTLTTISGFGSLMFSSYRGIATLGSALSIGVFYAFIITIVVIPLLLKDES